MLSSSNEIQKRPAIINFRVVFTPLRLCLLKAMFYELIEGKRLLHPTHRATKKFISEREKFFFRLRTINLGISIPRGVVDERRINKRWDFFFQSSLKRIRFLLRRSRVLERFSITEKRNWLEWLNNILGSNSIYFPFNGQQICIRCEQCHKKGKQPKSFLHHICSTPSSIRWVYFQSNLFLLYESGCGYGKRLSRLLGMVVSRDSIRTGTLFNFDLWNAIRAYIRCRRPRVGREDNETLINFYGFPCCSCYNPRSGLVKHQTRSEEWKARKNDENAFNFHPPTLRSSRAFQLRN